MFALSFGAKAEERRRLQKTKSMGMLCVVFCVRRFTSTLFSRGTVHICPYTSISYKWAWFALTTPSVSLQGRPTVAEIGAVRFAELKRRNKETSTWRLITRLQEEISRRSVCKSVRRCCLSEAGYLRVRTRKSKTTDGARVCSVLRVKGNSHLCEWGD